MGVRTSIWQGRVTVQNFLPTKRKTKLICPDVPGNSEDVGEVVFQLVIHHACVPRGPLLAKSGNPHGHPINEKHTDRPNVQKGEVRRVESRPGDNRAQANPGEIL